MEIAILIVCLLVLFFSLFSSFLSICYLIWKIKKDMKMKKMSKLNMLREKIRDFDYMIEKTTDESLKFYLTKQRDELQNQYNKKNNLIK